MRPAIVSWNVSRKGALLSSRRSDVIKSLQVGVAKRVILERAHASAEPREKEALTALGTRLTPGSGRVRIFVASLSEQGDLLSQWRGYCPNGAGYSIGFDASDLRHEAEIQRFRLVPCIYDDQEQREAIEKVLTEIMESERWVQALGDLGNDQVFRGAIEAWLDRFAPVAPTLKHPGFHEEREWRLISQPIWPGDPGWKVRPGRSMLIPYIPIKLTASGGYLPLDEIIVGPTPHMELACMAVGDWLNHEGLSSRLLKNSDFDPARDCASGTIV